MNKKQNKQHLKVAYSLKFTETHPVSKIVSLKKHLPTACIILSLSNAPVLENDMTQARSTTKILKK